MRVRFSHSLKLRDEYFSMYTRGLKMYECRLNDRGYSVGDSLFMRCIDESGNYTERYVLANIVSILPCSDISEEICTNTNGQYVLLGLDAINCYDLNERKRFVVGAHIFACET